MDIAPNIFCVLCVKWGWLNPIPPKPSIHPSIRAKVHWREYYRSRNLNLPHHYHNGGIWPLIGGLHVATLVRHGWYGDAEAMLVSLAKANRARSQLRMGI